MKDDKLPVLHMLGLPHTRTVSEQSHCAFTGKVRRFAMMMEPLGYRVHHYGVGLADSGGWDAQWSVLSPAEQRALLGYDPLDPTTAFIGRDAKVDHPVYLEFNRRLKRLLAKHVGPDDIICLPFGGAHADALTDETRPRAVETGIGYPDWAVGYRIYESYAWWHWHLAREDRHAWISEWVAPNYFDISEWPLRGEAPKATDYVLYFGRLIAQKGLAAFTQLAAMRPDLQFVMCGQGDPAPYLTAPNVKYAPPVHGRARAELMHGARVVLMPTDFTEPFGGVAIEAMLTGTPVLSSAFGAFTETLPESWRCRTAPEWLQGIETVLRIDPTITRRHAEQYGLARVGLTYDKIFQQILPMRKYGWTGAPRP